MSYRIFISSVQREFAKERKALADIVRKCKAWGLREPEYHPSDVDFRLVLWRKEIDGISDFTQGGGVGEVENKKGVKSEAETPVKSGARKLGTRLHPPAARGVESGGGVRLPMREEILLLLTTGPLVSVEIARRFGKKRVYGNLTRRIATLLDDKLIAQTLPEKPNSRLQKYKITAKGEQLARRIREGAVGGAQQ